MLGGILAGLRGPDGVRRGSLADADPDVLAAPDRHAVRAVRAAGHSHPGVLRLPDPGARRATTSAARSSRRSRPRCSTTCSASSTRSPGTCRRSPTCSASSSRRRRLLRAGQRRPAAGRPRRHAGAPGHRPRRRADWDGLRAWFLGTPGRRATPRTCAAWRPTPCARCWSTCAGSPPAPTASTAATPTCSGWPAGSTTATTDRPHALWAAAFGLYSVPPPRLRRADDDADPVPATARWWRAPGGRRAGRCCARTASARPPAAAAPARGLQRREGPRSRSAQRPRRRAGGRSRELQATGRLRSVALQRRGTSVRCSSCTPARFRGRRCARRRRSCDRARARRHVRAPARTRTPGPAVITSPAGRLTARRPDAVDVAGARVGRSGRRRRVTVTPERPAPASTRRERRRPRCRRCCSDPLLHADGPRADDLRLVRRHRDELQRLFAEGLGYRLVVEPRVARLFKAGLGRDAQPAAARAAAAQPLRPARLRPALPHPRRAHPLPGQLLRRRARRPGAQRGRTPGSTSTSTPSPTAARLHAALIALIELGVLDERDGDLEHWADARRAVPARRPPRPARAARRGPLAGAQSAAGPARRRRAARPPPGGARVAVRRRLLESPVLSVDRPDRRPGRVVAPQPQPRARLVRATARASSSSCGPRAPSRSTPTSR